jgi:hypothetical protein
MKKQTLILILFCISITSACTQVQLNQIQPAPEQGMFPVSDGHLNRQVYSKVNDYIQTSITPYSVLGDTLGFYYIIKVGEQIDSVLVLVDGCYNTVQDAVSTTLQQVIDYINNTSQAAGSTVSTANVGINTLFPEYTLDIVGVDAVRLPAGSTSQRPQELKPGLIRYNTETQRFEGYTGTTWVNLSTL